MKEDGVIDRLIHENEDPEEKVKAQDPVEKLKTQLQEAKDNKVSVHGIFRFITEIFFVCLFYKIFENKPILQIHVTSYYYNYIMNHYSEHRGCAIRIRNYG